MKRFVAVGLAAVCLAALGFAFGRHSRPDTQRKPDADCVVMIYSTDGEGSSEKVIITEEETIAELWEMHDSLRVQEKSRPLSDERMWIIFTRETMPVIEWCISVYREDSGHAEIITCSNAMGIGNHVIKSSFDDQRIMEIFRAASAS